jgi:NitT/TauT family transport system ATP-binding protein
VTSIDSATATAGATAAPTAPPEPLAALRVQGLSKVHGHGPGAVHALDGIDLEVRSGELLCLVGASGCGKSTLLNLIAGLDQPTAGTVDARGRTALMFQEAALFPWLTVRGNIELALKLRGVARKERRPQAEQLLHTVHLDGFGAKLPHELSGGMRQRVAIARAFAQEADLLLMDEPFGALDAMTRDLLHAELERLWADRNLSVVFVTHNVREAARLADRVVLLSSRPGRVVAEFDVDIERPRRMDSPEVSGLAAQITEQLREEVRRHAHI